MLRAIVIVCGILLGVLVAAIMKASGQGSVFAALGQMLADPWGLVTLLDLGVGLVFVAAWMSVMEPRPWCALAWIVALFLLGNVITMAFVIWRSRYASRFSDLFLPLRQDDRMGR